MIQFFDKDNEGINIFLVHPPAGIVTLQRFDHLIRIVNSQIEAVAGDPEEGPGNIGEFPGSFSALPVEIPEPLPPNHEFFQIDAASLLIGPFSDMLQFLEKRHEEKPALIYEITVAKEDLAEHLIHIVGLLIQHNVFVSQFIECDAHLTKHSSQI